MTESERVEPGLPELDRSDDPRGGAAAWAVLAVGAVGMIVVIAIIAVVIWVR